MHTNSIEGVWSLFKRSLVGSFHKVSRKHLSRYLEELEWRYNNRDNDHIFVDTLRRIVNTGALTYEELIGPQRRGTGQLSYSCERKDPRSFFKYGSASTSRPSF